MQRGFSYGVRHCEVTRPSSLVDFVSREILREELAMTALELIELGSVYVNDERSLSPSRPLLVGDRVRIHTKPRRYPQPIDLLSRIVSEDSNVVIVDKPAGLPVHALVDNIKENLISYLEDLRGGTLFITHRLDVETSGLVLLAKNAETQARLNRAFAEGTVKRTYAAYVTSPVAPGTYVHFMEPSPTAPKKVSAEAREGWSRCSLEVLSCEELSGETSVISEGRTTWSFNEHKLSQVFRLEISLQTGRPQQIRAQLAELGSPIIGDVSYGFPWPVVDTESSRHAITLRAIRVSI